MIFQRRISFGHNISRFIFLVWLVFSCFLTYSQETNNFPGAEGNCAYSQGHWFANPNIEWPFDVNIGGHYYTQEEGRRFFPSGGSTVKRAFTQVASLYLSETNISLFPLLESNVNIIENFFSQYDKLEPYNLPEANAEIGNAAGYIGDWIEKNNCEDTPCFINPENISITVTDITCGENFGSIYVQMNGAKPFFISLVYGCETNDASTFAQLNTQAAYFTHLIAGFYQITIIDANGCIFSECVEVKEIDLMDVTITVTDASCSGYDDGSIFVEMNGAKPFNISLEWGCNKNLETESTEFRTQTAFYSHLFAGFYLITVTDANGCVFIECVEVMEPDPFEVIVETDWTDCYDDNAGEATLTIFGGVLPYTLEWPGQDPFEIEGNTHTISGLSVGTHIVIITDADNCVTEITFTIEDYGYPIVLELEHTDLSCETCNDGTIHVSISGGVSPYNIFLHTQCDLENDLRSDLPDKSVNAFYTGLQAGWYMITVIDQKGCLVAECVYIGVDEFYARSLNCTGQNNQRLNEQQILHNSNYDIQNFININAYPNPFQSEVTFEFRIKHNSYVSLELIDINGKLLTVIYSGKVLANENNQIKYTVSSLPEGVYFYRIITANSIHYDRIILKK